MAHGQKLLWPYEVICVMWKKAHLQTEGVVRHCRRVYVMVLH